MFHDMKATINDFAEVDLSKTETRTSLLGAAISVAGLSNQKWNVGSTSLLTFLADLYDADCLTVYADLFGRPTAYVADVDCSTAARHEAGVLLLSRTHGSLRYLADLCFCEADPVAVFHKWADDRSPNAVKIRKSIGDTIFHVIPAELAVRAAERDLVKRYGCVPRQTDPIHIFDLRHLVQSGQELGDIVELLHRWKPEGWPCIVQMMQRVTSISEAGHLLLSRQGGLRSLIVWSMTFEAELAQSEIGTRDPLELDFQQASAGDTLALHLVVGDPKISVAAIVKIAERCGTERIVMREADATELYAALPPLSILVEAPRLEGWVRSTLGGSQG